MALTGLGLGAAIGKQSIGKGTLTAEQASLKSRIGKATNTAMNLGLSTLTEHKNGSVWDQLQR